MVSEMNGPSGVATSARVDITTATNCTWEDAFQFDPPGPTGGFWWGGVTGTTGPAWTFTGQNFRLDIKGNKTQAVALLSLTSAAGQIVVTDPINRILNFNVPESTITAVLVPGEYVYDFVMISSDVPPIRVQLMHGKFKVQLGITGG